MIHGVRFNPYSSDRLGIRDELVALRQRCPGLDTLVRLDTVGQPGAWDLMPTTAQVDALLYYLDDALAQGFRVWLNLYDYRTLSHAETARSVGGLSRGEPIPWDQPRVMPWTLPAVPEDNRSAVLAFFDAYLERVADHPALSAFVLRGAGHTAFGSEWQGAQSYVERSALTDFARWIIPQVRAMLPAEVALGIHVQPSFWLGPSGVGGAGYWMSAAAAAPELAGVFVDVSCKRLVDVALVCDEAEMRGLQLSQLCVSDHGLYHSQTPVLADGLGYLMRELGEARRRGVAAAWHWQYRPEGQATTGCFRDALGNWNSAIVGLYSASATNFAT